MKQIHYNQILNAQNRAFLGNQLRFNTKSRVLV